MDRHIITSAWWFGLISLALCLVNPAAAQVDQQRAEAYFKEAATICQRDGGRLWGVSLARSMLGLYSHLRAVVGNHAEVARILRVHRNSLYERLERARRIVRSS